MENKRIFTVLLLVLAAACVIMGVILVSVNREIGYLPEAAVDDLVEILGKAGITIDKATIPVKRERGSVYVCDSGNYDNTVAQLLGESNCARTYIIPDGKIIVLESGAMIEFGNNFSFRFFRDGEASPLPDTIDLSKITNTLNQKKEKEISSLATDFLERGSKRFDGNGKVNVVTIVENVWEDSGKYYAMCTREIDGVEITNNTVMCTVEDGVVTEARGTWCFLTLCESYSAQLSDILNILFSVKKEIAAENKEDQPLRIESVEMCYSLYFFGDDDAFCLIPCFKITTDKMGEFIYNAIDSTLYTKN